MQLLAVCASSTAGDGQICTLIVRHNRLCGISFQE
jgi:hypothetical protein